MYYDESGYHTVPWISPLGRCTDIAANLAKETVGASTITATVKDKRAAVSIGLSPRSLLAPSRRA